MMKDVCSIQYAGLMTCAGINGWRQGLRSVDLGARFGDAHEVNPKESLETRVPKEMCARQPMKSYEILQDDNSRGNMLETCWNLELPF